MLSICFVTYELYDIIPEENTELKFSCLKHNLKKYIIIPAMNSDEHINEASSRHHYFEQLNSFISESITDEDYINNTWCKTFIESYQEIKASMESNK